MTAAYLDDIELDMVSDWIDFHGSELEPTQLGYAESKCVSCSQRIWCLSTPKVDFRCVHRLEFYG